MSTAFLYALVGVGLFSLGLYSLIVHAHLLRKILALNVMGNGVFMVLVALARRTGEVQPDAVPHAMVITGIVVAVSATALALTLMLKLTAETGRAELNDNQRESH
ncbi:MAG: NADH-quinone oxidoreductase subunit K [Desulforhopalus sp.]